MKIGILQCGHAIEPVKDRHGDYADMFERLLSGHGFEFATYNVVDGEFPASVHAAEGWLLTGSRHGVYEDLPFLKPLEDFVRQAYGAHVPMVGICFGHQIIAQALGGSVVKHPGGWAIGHRSYDFEGVGPISLNAWHQDQVVTPPPQARTIASNDFCRHAALVYDDDALTVQAHPEFQNDVLAEYVRLRRGAPGYPDDVMDLAEKQGNQSIDDQTLADMIGTFFLKKRSPDV